MLADINLMVCDIQDIGVRYYTFLWTLTHILEACGEQGVPVLILDRPNPLGDYIDGGGLEPELASLVGRFPIPIQHGMTIGELALMVNDLWNPTPAEVEIMRCDGWNREGCRWPFVPPSPNMPHLSTALHYPGACLVEGTQLSEGRGTALPFEIVGAPFIDGFTLAEALNSLPRAVARPHAFQPTASKFAGEICSGVQIHMLEGFRPLEVWLRVLHTIRHLYPDQFEWIPYHFDRLIGDTTTRQQIEDGVSVEDIVAGWQDFHQAFREQRAPYLLYEAAHA
jgi:uncharacterized protein YbbC (DUF1343 family)